MIKLLDILHNIFVLLPRFSKLMCVNSMAQDLALNSVQQAEVSI